MVTRIWRVMFGGNVEITTIEAQDIDEAIAKARKEYAEQIKECDDDYWISAVELIAEADY